MKTRKITSGQKLMRDIRDYWLEFRGYFKNSPRGIKGPIPGRLVGYFKLGLFLGGMVVFIQAIAGKFAPGWLITIWILAFAGVSPLALWFDLAGWMGRPYWFVSTRKDPEIQLRCHIAGVFTGTLIIGLTALRGLCGQTGGWFDLIDWLFEWAGLAAMASIYRDGLLAVLKAINRRRTPSGPI